MRAMLFALLALVVTACGSEARQAAQQPQSHCSQRSFEGSRFTVCDPRDAKLVLFAAAGDERPLRSFAEIAQQVDPNEVAFAMNAGMFDEEGRPIGLAIVDGSQVHAINRRDGGGNFHMKPNGIFLVRRDGSAEVVTSDDFEPADDIRLATQSGPMLVIDGELHPRFEPDGTSRHIRNGVGVTAAGKPLFVISADPVSFGKFARFFRDALEAPNALYFDGAVSSLWDPANFRQDSRSDLGPVIVAVRPAESAPGREGRARP